MVFVAAGTFQMGSVNFYPEEAPVRPVHLDGFWIDRHPVTVGEFARFVAATGYVTLAERPLDPADYPDADPAWLVPGALVFHPINGPVALDNPAAWWRYVPGASWRHPEGPGSDVDWRGDHPVVQVAHEDASAYAAWAGMTLPSEAEFERAARGGLEAATFCWGEEFRPDGRLMANTWHGRFPVRHTRPDRWLRTSPVGTYPPNGFGLYDMAGNVWEWTDDFFSTPDNSAPPRSCCTPGNPRVSEPVATSYVANEPGAQIPRRVVKGGSHLCAANYCLRYRPAARQGEAIDTSTGHIGFRCVARD